MTLQTCTHVPNSPAYVSELLTEGKSFEGRSGTSRWKARTRDTWDITCGSFRSATATDELVPERAAKKSINALLFGAIRVPATRGSVLIRRSCRKIRKGSVCVCVCVVVSVCICVSTHEHVHRFFPCTHEVRICRQAPVATSAPSVPTAHQGRSLSSGLSGSARRSQSCSMQ